MVLHFEIYQGKRTPLPDDQLGIGPAFVLRLTRTLPPGSKVFFDRYFTTLPLLDRLLQKGIYGTGTIMKNRIKCITATDERKMKRDDMEEFCSPDDKHVIVQWKDSKSVFLASSAFGCSPVNDVKRWCKKEKRFLQIPCPSVVKEYNTCMGGVDICDQQMEAYRTFFKTRKWPLKVIIHFLDLACVNAWMEYREDSLKNEIPRKDVLDLLNFRLVLAEALVNIKKKIAVEWNSESEEGETPAPPPPTKRHRPADKPCNEKRHDGYNHWPVEEDLKSAKMCRLEGCSSRTRTKCEKCNVYLCLSKHKNCFKSFHINK